MRGRSRVATVLLLCAAVGVSFVVSSVICSRRAASETCVMPSQCANLITQYLRLTPDQQRRIAPINDRFAADQHAACVRMQEARGQLLSVLKQPQPKQYDVEAALDNLTQAQSELQSRAAHYLLELKPVLRNGQQEKLFELVGQRFCEQGRCGGGICPGVGKPGCGGMPGCTQ